MSNLDIQERDPPLADALALYDSVGWTAYTQHPDRLQRAITGSHFIVVAYRGRRLVGLARTVSDDASVWFLQDLLVHPEEQGRGLGQSLLQRCAQRYRHVPRGVLLTDADGPVAFYAREGWEAEPRIRMLLHSR